MLRTGVAGNGVTGNGVPKHRRVSSTYWRNWQGALLASVVTGKGPNWQVA